MDNIYETPTLISTMILGVVILIVDFFSKLIFVRELMILRKSDELLLHNEFLNLCHIGCIRAHALEACDFFPRSCGGDGCITSWRIC